MIEELKEVREALQSLILDAENFREQAEGHLSISDYELNAGLGESDASLHVVSIPKAKEAVAKLDAVIEKLSGWDAIQKIQSTQ